jgi:hypothetical protein
MWGRGRRFNADALKLDLDNKHPTGMILLVETVKQGVLKVKKW